MSRLVVAASVVDAVERLSRDDGLRPIAAGVGVMLARATGERLPWSWIAVGQLPELRVRDIDSERPAVTLGAGLTLEEVADERSRTPVPPLLAMAARAAANPGIRAVATIGGNVVANGPRSDLVAALIALDAEADVVGADGPSRRTVAALVGGDGAPAVWAGQLITAFHIPLDATGVGWQRLTIRGAMDRSSASVAVAVTPNEVRVVATCASGSVVDFPTVGSLVAGARSAVRLPDVRAAAGHDLAPIDLDDDDRASADYRRRALPVLVERAVEAALVGA